MNQFRVIGISFLVTALTVGCGGGASSSTPPSNNNAIATSSSALPTIAPTLAPSESTPVQIEQTPTEVQATNEAATDTPEPIAAPTVTIAAPGNLPEDLANAVNKTKDLKALRYDLTLNLTLTKNGKEVTTQYTLKGEGNGTDDHLSFSGTDAKTGKPISYESIKTGGKSYEKGLPFGIADPNTWYELPAAESSSLTNSAQTPRGVLSSLKADEFKPGNFAPSSIEVVDLQPCEVWVAQTPEVLTPWMQSSNNPDEAREFKAIDSHDGRVWTCVDGYLHQVKLLLTGHDPAKPSDKATFDLAMHVYDQNSAITINPPANAQPFPIK